MEKTKDNDDSDSPQRPPSASSRMEVAVEVHQPPQPQHPLQPGLDRPLRLTARIFNSPAEAREHLMEIEQRRREMRVRLQQPVDLIEEVSEDTPTPPRDDSRIDILLSPRRPAPIKNKRRVVQIHRDINEVRYRCNGRFPLFIEMNQYFYPYRVPRIRTDFDFEAFYLPGPYVIPDLLPSPSIPSGPSSAPETAIFSISPLKLKRRPMSDLDHAIAVAVLSGPTGQEASPSGGIELQTYPVRETEPVKSPSYEYAESEPGPSRPPPTDIELHPMKSKSTLTYEYAESEPGLSKPSVTEPEPQPGPSGAVPRHRITASPIPSDSDESEPEPCIPPPPESPKETAPEDKDSKTRPMTWDDIELIDLDVLNNVRSSPNMPLRRRRGRYVLLNRKSSDTDFFTSTLPMPSALSMWTSPLRTLRACFSAPIIMPDTEFCFTADTYCMIQCNSLFAHFVQYETERRGLVFPFVVIDEPPLEFRTFIKLTEEFEKTRLRRRVFELAQNINFHRVRSRTFPDMVHWIYNMGTITIERVLMFYTFCCDLCIRCLIFGREDNFMQFFAWTLKYICIKIARVIEKCGGLETLINERALKRKISVSMALSVGAFGVYTFFKNKLTK